MTMIRGLLVSVIFNDALQLEAGSAVASSAQTLVTTDVDRICGAFESVHEIWANVVELGIAIWLLERETGVGCLGPAAVVISMLSMVPRRCLVADRSKSALWPQGRLPD